MNRNVIYTCIHGVLIDCKTMVIYLNSNQQVLFLAQYAEASNLCFYVLASMMPQISASFSCLFQMNCFKARHIELKSLSNTCNLCSKK